MSAAHLKIQTTKSNMLLMHGHQVKEIHGQEPCASKTSISSLTETKFPSQRLQVVKLASSVLEPALLLIENISENNIFRQKDDF